MNPRNRPPAFQCDRRALPEPVRRDRTLGGWTEDSRRLLGHLALRWATVLGVSGGGPYAMPRVRAHFMAGEGHFSLPVDHAWTILATLTEEEDAR